MKKTVNSLLLIVVLVMLYFILSHFGILPTFGNPFRTKPVTIDNTPILIEEMRELRNLVSVTIYDEVVIASEKDEKQYIGNPMSVLPLSYTSKARIVLVGRGTVMAGVNFFELKEADCFVKDDSVSLHLPPATILETSINPSGFETFTETGHWTEAEVTSTKQQAKQQMEQRALAQNILSKATLKSKQVVERFLRLAGFKKIVITP